MYTNRVVQSQMSTWLKLRIVLYIKRNNGTDQICDFVFCKFSHDASRYLSRVVRKPAFCICENKDADQLSGNREADQRLCFRYTDSTIPLLPESEISSL